MSALLDGATLEEQAFLANLKPKVVYDAHGTFDKSQHTQSIVPLTDEDKEEWLLLFRRQKEMQAGEAAKAAAKDAILKGLGITSEDIETLGWA